MEYKWENGFQSFLTDCDFSLYRVAPFGTALNINHCSVAKLIADIGTMKSIHNFSGHIVWNVRDGTESKYPSIVFSEYILILIHTQVQRHMIKTLW